MLISPVSNARRLGRLRRSQGQREAKVILLGNSWRRAASLEAFTTQCQNINKDASGLKAESEWTILCENHTLAAHAHPCGKPFSKVIKW